MRTITFVLSLVLCFMIPWEGVIRIPGLGSGVRLLGYALSAFWLATILITGRLRKPGPFQIAVLVLVVWNAASIFWSVDPDRSISSVMTWLLLLMLVFIWWDLFTTRNAVRAGLQAFVLGAYVAIGSAIGNYLAGYQFYTHYDRYSPGQTNPDGFGFMLVLGMPLAWYLATSAPESSQGRLWRFINYAYIPAAFLGIALSGTRTAVIASIIASLYGLAGLSRVRPWLRAVFTLALISAAVFSIPYLQTLKSFQRLATTGTELTQGDLNNRTNIWREGLMAFVEHPVLGIGSDTYPTINSWDKAAHNSFLAVLVELGLVGFAFFAIILAIAFNEAWRQPKWESLFWLTVLAVWTIGASTLTWGDRKPTWLLLSLLIASAALTDHREETVALFTTDGLETQAIPRTQTSA